MCIYDVIYNITAYDIMGTMISYDSGYDIIELETMISFNYHLEGWVMLCNMLYNGGCYITYSCYITCYMGVLHNMLHNML
jgi:hypothetical protein